MRTSRHQRVLQELRAAGLLTWPAGHMGEGQPAVDMGIIVSRLHPAEMGDASLAGRAERIHHNVYSIRLREFPVVTDRGEYVLLHEIAHIAARHFETRLQPDHIVEWEADVWVMLRRPQWAEWIAAEMRPRVRSYCEQWQQVCRPDYRWWRALCQDVGFVPTVGTYADY